MWDDSVEFLFQSRLQFKSGRVLFHSSQHVPPLIALMPCWVSSSFSSLAEAANFITLKTYTALLEVVGNREKLFKKKEKILPWPRMSPGSLPWQHLQAGYSILQWCVERRTLIVYRLSCGRRCRRCWGGTGRYSSLGGNMMDCILFDMDEPQVKFVECAMWFPGLAKPSHPTSGQYWKFGGTDVVPI